MAKMGNKTVYCRPATMTMGQKPAAARAPEEQNPGMRAVCGDRFTVTGKFRFVPGSGVEDFRMKVANLKSFLEQARAASKGRAEFVGMHAGRTVIARCNRVQPTVEFVDSISPLLRP